MTELDTLDRALLERLQSHFPMTPRPFAALGRILGVSENEVLGRVRRLKDENIIRQIGAIFDTRCLGYLSTLAAFHVAGDRLAAVAAQVSAHRGVSHNYARLHHYNLWFTMAVPPDHDVVDEISRLAQRAGVEDWLNLPATRVFKVKTHFELDRSGAPRQTGRPQRSAKPQRAFSQADIPFVRALQGDLPLIPRPFAPASRRLGLSEEDLLSKARELEATGIMRRFSAVLRHRRVGYTANGMACWVVPDARIEKVGLQAAAFPQISHCYQRPAFPPRWPYSLFTMIHGKKTDEVEAVVADIARQTDIEHYEILYSTREFKKERVRYFEEVT